MTHVIVHEVGPNTAHPQASKLTYQPSSCTAVNSTPTAVPSPTPLHTKCQLIFLFDPAVDDHPDPAWEGTDESKRPSISGYNWGGVIKMDSTDPANLRSVRNPDNFAYWVALGRFWDNQFKASQDPRDLPRGKFIKDTSAPVNPYPPPAAKGRLVKMLRL